ncbi:MAG: type II toxin-antitoxin system VapC family toxin [Thermodesulfobacteriota bacterium]
MVIDSSALIALLLDEMEAGRFAQAIANDPRRIISVINWLETAIVIEAKKGEPGGRELDLLLHRTQMEIVSMNPDQSEIARVAWRHYGKGNHPAGLNIGDCCAYALAKYAGEPLLFKGEDFSQTDILPVSY